MLSRLLHSTTKSHKTATIHSIQTLKTGVKSVTEIHILLQATIATFFIFHPNLYHQYEYYLAVIGDWLFPDNVFFSLFADVKNTKLQYLYIAAWMR